MPLLLLSLLKGAGLVFIQKLVSASFTERILADVFFKTAKYLAKQSTNEMDDDMVEKIRVAYYNENVDIKLAVLPTEEK